jgi:hypothetical protein
MSGCGGCGHGHGHCHDWGYGAEPMRAPYWGCGRTYMAGPVAKDEMIDGLQEYKENLEAEIRRLEKRIGSLREKPSSD